MIEVTIGQCLLQNLLDRRGLSQQQLADLIGMQKSRVSDYCRNTRPSMSLSTAKLIATALNCNIDDLYEWKVKR